MNEETIKTEKNISQLRNSTRSIIFILLALICIGAYVFIFRTITIGRTANTELQKKIFEQNDTLSETTELREIIARTEEDRTKINTYFVTKDTINIFFDRLEGLSEYSNVATEIASAKEIPLDADGNAELEVAITTDGSFEDIYQFMLLLENLPFQIQIIGFEILRSEAQTIQSTPAEGVFSIATNEETLTRPWRGKFLIRLESYLAE